MIARGGGHVGALGACIEGEGRALQPQDRSPNERENIRALRQRRPITMKMLLEFRPLDGEASGERGVAFDLRCYRLALTINAA